MKDKSKGNCINEATANFRMLFGIGIMLLILSGVTLMAITQGAFGEQIWFRIKFGLIVAVILNGVVVGRRQGVKLTRILSEETSEKNSTEKLLKVKRNIHWFHASQMVFFIIIFYTKCFQILIKRRDAFKYKNDRSVN